MSDAEYDIKAIMYPAYGTHHRLRNISGNKIPLTQEPISTKQTKKSFSVITFVLGISNAVYLTEYV